MVISMLSVAPSPRVAMCMVGIQYLYLAVALDVSGGNFAGAYSLYINSLDALAVYLGDYALDVEDDVGDVFLNSGE
jgi:hypothetical protein